MSHAGDNPSPLSHGQRALWYLRQLEPRSTAYHLGVCLRLEGAVDEAALAAAWDALGQAHPQLRARFGLRAEEPVTFFGSPAPLLKERGDAKNLEKFWREFACRPFDLAAEPPVRALFLRAENGPAHFLLCVHHIAADLWSAAIGLRELSAVYSALIAGRTPELFGEGIPYAAFAEAEGQWLAGPAGLAAENFWCAELAGNDTTPIFTRSQSRGNSGEIPVALGIHESALVHRAAREHTTTPFNVLLAAYARLIAEAAGREETIVGTPVTLRDHAALRRTIGYCVNAVPIRCPARRQGGDALTAVAAASNRALAHRRFPFSVLVERLGLPRAAGTTPLFQTMFAYQALPRTDRGLLPLALNAGGAGWDFGAGIQVETVALPPFDAQFPVTLALGPQAEGFAGRLQYDGRRVTAEMAAKMAEHFPRLVREIADGGKSRPVAIARKAAAERLEHLFDAAAQRAPDALAMSEDGRNLTYAEVKQRAEILAAVLDSILPGDARPVAIQMSSCAEAVICILAILMSGRAFQPIDPGEPSNRRNAALERTGAGALMLPAGATPGVLPEGVKAFDVAGLQRVRGGAIRVGQPSRTAYLIQTSGSTGEPRVVEVEHSALLNHARVMARQFALTQRDRILQFYTLAFDAAYEEIFPAWVAGAGNVLAPRVREFGVPALFELARQSGITVLCLPASYWHTLAFESARLKLAPLASLRLVVSGGEPASPRALAVWRKLHPHARWINAYGPTETAITALTYEAPPNVRISGNMPIGRPIAGATALVLDANGAPVSVGVGELLIGGAGLAKGYCGDPAATAAKFVQLNLAGTVNRYYRTGDRVRIRKDGIFEYLGRLDRQVKIRGHRVDPDEIERALLTHPAVANAAVAVREIGREPGLAAWIERADQSLTAANLRGHLSKLLPAAMIPTRLFFPSRLPKKPGGKRDLAALQPPPKPAAKQKMRGLADLTGLFSEALSRRIDPGDDFFLSGGHSLLAIKLIGRVEARFGVRLAVSDFVAAPTARSLWARIQNSAPADVEGLLENSPEKIPVSAQQRRALLALEVGRPSLGNIVLALRVDGRLDSAALARAWESLAARHFLLRAGIAKSGADLLLVEAASTSRLERRVLAGRNFARSFAALVREESQKSFVPDGRAPWFRLLLVSAAANRNPHLILITHHAVADGWALELLLAELRSAYENRPPCAAPIPAPDYRTYALRQARWLESPAAAVQKEFWRTQLAGATVARLPFRRTAPVGVPGEIQRHEVKLPAQLSRDFRRTAAALGTTPFVLALAAFKVLLQRHTGQADLTLGTVVANRASTAEQALLGPLQNPVLIRNQIVPAQTLRSLVRGVARTLAAAQDNGGLPFELVRREAFPASLSAGHAGIINFLSHDPAIRAQKFGSASLQLLPQPPGESPFELSVGVTVATSRIRLALEFRPECYAEADIAQFAAQFGALLKSAAANPDARIGALNLTTAGEIRAFKRRMATVHRPCRELLHAGFARQVQSNPAAVALMAGKRQVSYGELDKLVGAVASRLIHRGLKLGGLVAVMLPKGWEQVTACLAILRAGGVYVPVDPGLPDARLEVIFNQGGFQAVITADPAIRSAAWARKVHSICTLPSIPGDAAGISLPAIKPDTLAYVIFTSGSTGVPKGVMLPHQAAMTTIAEINRRFQLGRHDRVFAASSLGFDLSVFDIFGTLRAGGAIVMPPSPDPRHWLNEFEAAGTTVWNSAPCLFEIFLAEARARGSRLKSLRLILLSGDFIPLPLARRIRQELPHAKLVSLGGATEGAIWSIARTIDQVDSAWRSVPYGRPLRNQEMFVLDRELNPCPAGVAGELFIAGAGLATGYWRNARETRRRFLTHPSWNVRLYRTGDQGRELANGEIEILGRQDGQVKLNGVRIELGEIEAALGAFPGVRQVVAEIRDDGAGGRRLVAHVAAPPGTSTAALAAQARKMLPAALVPSGFVVRERFPLTANGKVDRLALGAVQLEPGPSPTQPPQNSAEQWIAELWRDLLGAPNAGVEDDFFLLGGHSLLAIKMLQRVRAHFRVELPLTVVFERPTVKALAEAVRMQTSQGSPSATRDAESGNLAAATSHQRATAELERDAEPVIEKMLRSDHRAARGILLTGVTGHLGSALLVELLKANDEVIHCLVRAGSAAEADARLMPVLLSRGISESLARRRIRVVPADLRRERFGLAAADFETLAVEIHAAYHCAAEVNFIAPYETLAPANVGGVRELIRLVTAGGGVLHHVSSAAVFPYGARQIARETDDISKIETLAGGYAQSKWTAERMVWKAMTRGLRAVIYRPTQILGRTAGSSNDLFGHVLRACVALQAIPDLDAQMDMIPAGYAARAMAALSAREASVGRAFHLAQPRPVSLRSFAGLLPPPLPVIPLEDWLARLHARAQVADDSGLQFVSLLAHGMKRADLTPPVMDCRGTLRSLRGTGIECPPLDGKFIRREIAPSLAGQ